MTDDLIIEDNTTSIEVIDGANDTNATRLQGINISTTDPTNAQLLGFNSSTSVWEPTTAGGTGDMLIATYDAAGVSEQLAGLTASQVITNKTIDADSNTITNIENADIKSAAAIAVNKLAALTASEMVISDASGFLSSAAVATYPSLTELTYLKGVTSAIQTQLNAKGVGDMTAAVYDPAAITEQLVGLIASQTLTNKSIDSDNNTITNITNADIKAAAAIAVNKLAALTASEMVISDGSGFLTSAAVATYPSLTELTYLKGVTSDIQTQLNAKLAIADIDDTPVNAEVAQPISSNWAYDHENDTTAHGATGANVGTTNTQTITNKWNQRRVVTTTQSATPSINTDNGDVFNITALAQAITSFTTNLTGTPINKQLMEIDITDNATGRAITWGASFADSGTVTLPTTTVASTLLHVYLQYDTVSSKWLCVGKA